MKQRGLAIIEVTIASALLLLVIFSGVKVAMEIQKDFKHDFIEKKSPQPQFEIKLSKQLVFFKNAKERRAFKESHDSNKAVTLKKIGILL